ncbi:unnamed protein product, partial [Heterosigma akashiwo]
YPRDWLCQGRLLVRLTREDGTPYNPKVPTRRALLVEMGRLIPKLSNRQRRLQ